TAVETGGENGRQVEELGDVTQGQHVVLELVGREVLNQRDQTGLVVDQQDHGIDFVQAFVRNIAHKKLLDGWLSLIAPVPATAGVGTDAFLYSSEGKARAAKGAPETREITDRRIRQTRPLMTVRVHLARSTALVNLRLQRRIRPPMPGHF